MTIIEKALLPLSRRHPALHEFLWFGLKQAWACLFGALLLACILVTRLWYLLMQLSFILIYALRRLEEKLGVQGPEKIIPGKAV
jgi:uncharacterized membrane protein YoaT (DUF817 family)